MNKYEESGIWGVVTWSKIVKLALQVYIWVAIFVWINCCAVIFGNDPTISDIAIIFRFVGDAATSLFFVAGCLWIYNECFLTYLDEEIEGATKKRICRFFAFKWFAFIVGILVCHYLSSVFPFSLMTS